MNRISIRPWEVLSLALALALALVAASPLAAQNFSEGFDNITTLAGSGWFMQNNSSPVGSLGWFQASTVFAAQAGAATSYIGANYNNTTGANTISNWLVTPARIFVNGDTLTFYTRIPTAPPEYPDRLEIRLSTNGTSTNVGTLATDVGDFTALLLSVNPTLVTGVYPQVWTQFTATVSGVPTPTLGRFAFRYFVTDGGPSGNNSNYIGIDTVAFTTTTPVSLQTFQAE
jgi:hypothetical protein